MAIRHTHVTLKGTSALLMNRFPLDPPEAMKNKSKEEQAEYAAYRTPHGSLYVPGINIQRALVASAVFSKGKGRASLQKQVAACVMVSPEYCELGVSEYAVDSRAVVIAATKGRIVRHRPRLDTWVVSFDVEWDDTLISETELRRVVDDMGTRVGLLDFRPEKKGPFGRSVVVEWKAA